MGERITVSLIVYQNKESQLEWLMEKIIKELMRQLMIKLKLYIANQSEIPLVILSI